jgi:2-haloacid dehalogenase
MVRDVLRYALASEAAGSHRAFEEIIQGILQLKAEALGVSLTNAEVAGVRRALNHLPPFKDVRQSLSELAKQFRLAVLTQSSPETVRAQLANAQLSSLFEHILSVEPVNCYRPTPAAYEYVAHHLG